MERDNLIYRAAHIVPSARQLAWLQMELTAFIHYTVNAFTDKEWGDGTESPSIFNPSDCSPRQWAEVCKNAGFKMIILTCKHHDGFCLWPSKFTEHSVKNSPWKNGKGDIVRELSDACREFGVKFGVYLSPWDRHEQSYGDSPVYNQYFKNQLTELLTNYGEIACVWFDGACAEGPNGKRQEYDWDGYYELIYSLQPGILISDIGPDIRWCGNEAGKARPAEWSVLNVNKNVLAFNYENCTLENIGGRDTLGDGNDLKWYPSEVDTSIRPGWFYHRSEDDEVKSPAKLMDIYFNSIGHNGVLLLNIPPDKRGHLHENDVKNLLEFNRLLQDGLKENLASGAKIQASIEREWFPAANIINGNPDAFWQTPPWAESATIELDLGVQKTFNCVMLQEHIQSGQRIEKYSVHAQIDGQWQPLTSGFTVGYKEMQRFEKVTTSRVKLEIHESRYSPTLSNFALYRFPEIQEEAPVKVESLGLPKQTKKIHRASSENLPEFPAANLLDGNPDSCWSSKPGDKMPQFVQLDLGQMFDLKGFIMLPNQHGGGHIFDYEFYVSANGSDWGSPIVAGQFSNLVNNPVYQKIYFDEPQSNVRFICLKALTACENYAYIKLADLNVIPAK
ncbi:MAG: alpha-L-fucosidase [Victivallaceae bacterium]